MKPPFLRNDVAVIIPVAGRPALLREAIRSVLVGSQLPGELIVVVNSQGPEREADRDAASEEFQIHQSRLPRGLTLKILFSERSGPAAARNEGVAATDRRWIAFLDSDDLWKPKKLELQMEYLRKRPHLQGCQTLEEWWKDGELLRQPARLRPGLGTFYGAAMENCLVSPSSVVLKREVLQALSGFNESYPVCEDFELWLRYLRRFSMGLLDLPLTVKRSGGWKQLSRETHSMDRYRIQAILEQARTNGIPAGLGERARQICMEKFGILEQGAKKRGNPHVLQGLKEEITEFCVLDSVSSASPD